MLARLEHLDGLATATWNDEVRDEIGARITEWDSVLSTEPVIARQILRKLIAGRIVMTPKTDDRGRWYEFNAETSYGRLLDGIVLGGRSTSLVPPG